MNTTPSASATTVPLRRRLTSALLVLGLTLGTIAMTASPVDAASLVHACFQRVGPNPYSVSGYPVKLQAWNGVLGRWEQIGVSQETVQWAPFWGCTSFAVPFPYQDKFLRTNLETVGSGGWYYFGYSANAFFLWPQHNTWYPMTIFGNQYAPYAPYAFYNFPGVDTWILQGTFECQKSYPVPLTPC